MDFTRRLLLGSLVLAVYLVCSHARGEQLVNPRARGEHVIRIATLMPMGTSWMKELSRFARRVRKLTDARVQIRFHAGAIMGDERDVVSKMQRGRLHGGMLSGTGLGMVLPSLRVLELPYLFRSSDEISAVRARLEDELRAGFRAKGYVLLNWGDLGWVHLFTVTPLRTTADLARTRIWAWADDPLARALVDKLGMRAVPLAVQGVLPALQSGIVDTVYGAPYTTVALQWHTQLRFISTARITYATGGLLISARVFDALTPRQKQILRAEGRILQRRHMHRMRQDNQAALDQLRRMGLSLQRADRQLTQRLEQRSHALWNELAGKIYPRQLLDRVIQLRDAQRQKQARGARH